MQKIDTNRIAYIVGANNETGKIDKARIVEVLDQHFEGFNFIDGTGRWKGTNEPCLTVLTFDKTDLSTAESIGLILKKELKQDSVLMEFNSEKYFI